MDSRVMETVEKKQAQPSYADAWAKVKRALASQYGEAVYKSWIRHLRFMRFSGDELVLSAPTRFVKEWVSNNYTDSITLLWKMENPSVKRVSILVKQEADKALKPKTVGGVDVEGQNVRVLDVVDCDELSSPLDRRFTFDNFITGASNELPFAAAKSVAEMQETVVGSNPLFLYGGVGLGKTHLMHAVALYIRENQPERRVIYLSAEKFMYLFVQALRNNDILSFKERFRSVDVLLIDDVQFICGKGSTQEEFFHTLDTLFNQNKQVIISCNSHPCDLKDMDERIRSRLAGGLVVDINNTDFDLRLGVLRSKVKQMKNIEVPEDVLEFLAGKITSNVRELEGSLNKVVAHSTLVGKKITLDEVRNILSDLLRVHDKVLTILDIQRKVADYYNIKLSDLTSTSRMRCFARPRQIAMYIAKEMTSRSLSEIGRKFGGKDHTTVMHAIRRVQELVHSDKEFKEDLRLLMRALQG